MVYQNPGNLFVDEYGFPQNIDDVIRYVNFLRETAHASIDPPVSLDPIYKTFHIPPPKHVPLPKLQGVLISDKGQILINEGDYHYRQRFTEAHELVEMLFSALPETPGLLTRRVGAFKHDVKERLCNKGAAELLMPRTIFEPRARSLGISMKSGKVIAEEFRVSVQAALIRMVEELPGRHALVLLKMKSPKNETRNRQPDLFGEMQDARASQPYLCVEWAFTMPNIPRIYPDTPIPFGSDYYRIYQDGEEGEMRGLLELGGYSGKGQWEAIPIKTREGRKIISLVHLPGDLFCK